MLIFYAHRGNHWESAMTSAAKKTEIAVKFRVQVDETMNEDDCCAMDVSSLCEQVLTETSSKEEMKMLMEKKARLNDHASALRDIFLQC